MTRKLSPWVDTFVAATDHLPSPLLFRKWCAISAIAGALERKVWIRSMGESLYPNLYVLLVGAPGVGKTIISSKTEDLWHSLIEHHVAPKSLTKASLIDSLNDAHRPALGGIQDFHSLKIHAGELGVLLPAYENDFMNVLTDIYDGRIYEERRRTKDLHIKLLRPQLNMLMCTTPSYLNNVLPEGAWDQGFLSRTMIVYAGTQQRRDLFGEQSDTYEAQLGPLKADLTNISRMVGQMQIEPEAAEFLNAWHMSGGEPTPDHPKLINYVTRRTLHLLKLCMVASASRGDDLTITILDVGTALDWLLEVESQIPEVFTAMATRGSAAAIDEAWHFLFQKYSATKQPIAENRLVMFLSTRVPSHEVLRVIEIMEKSGSIKKDLSSSGFLGWVPVRMDY